MICLRFCPETTHGRRPRSAITPRPLHCSRADASVSRGRRSHFSSWNSNFKFKSFPQKVHKLTVQTPKLYRPPLPETNGMILAHYSISSQREGKVIFLQSEPLRPAGSQGQQPQPFQAGAFGIQPHTYPQAPNGKTRAQGALQPGTAGTGDTRAGAT